MNIEKQKEEALKLLLDWYASDCGYKPCAECGFGEFCERGADIVTGDDSNE